MSLVLTKRLSSILISLCCLAVSSAGAAEGGGYQFQRIGEAAGLAPDVITTIFRDDRGLLWIGSREGLYLFDGYSARRFIHEPDKAGTISDNSIRTIFQDRSGRLWFGTNSGGMCHLDRGGSDFVCVRPDPETPRSLSHESVYGFAEDKEGAIWVGTQEGLNRIDPGSGLIENVPFGHVHPEGQAREYVATLFVDSAGNLWVGTVASGLFVRRQGTEQFEFVGAEQGYQDTSAFCFLEDSRGDLWIGGFSRLSRKKSGENQFSGIDLLAWSEDESVYVSALVETESGLILASTFGDGLLEIAPDSLEVNQFKPVAGEVTSLPESRLMYVTKDPGGGILLATWGSGLQRTMRASRFISGIDEFIDFTGVLSSLEDVESLHTDDHGRIWAGSSSNGLLQIEESGAGPSMHGVPLGDLTNPASVLYVRPESPERVMVGTTTGMIELDPQTLDVIEFRNDPDDPASLGAGYVTSLLRDEQGQLWIGTGGSGVWRMSADRALAAFRADPGDSASLGGDYVTAMMRDEFGYIWVATRAHGLSRCRPEGFHCRTFDPSIGEGRGLQHHYVTAFFLDRDGILWVGTAGGGVHRVQRARDGTVMGFDRFGVELGLHADMVLSFLEDDDGSLWLGTRRGLSRISADRNQVANFLSSDGLISTVFSRGAAARTVSRLYFGTADGLIHIPAGLPFEPSRSAPLVFTQAHNLTSGAMLGGLNRGQSSITVNHGEVLQFAFALLDYEIGGHRYAYRLGEKGDWTNLESSRQITFGDIPPGNHSLRVRGWSARGAMSEVSLNIDVVPPFWMTYWFRILLFLVVILLALGAHNLRMAGLHRRNQELQRLHGQRERALLELQRSETELNEAARGLRRLASRLESAKEEERQHISRELHDELGQTLTAAKISLQLLQNEDGIPRDRLQSAIRMMDDMIRQVRTISLNLRPPLLDEAGLVPALKSELKQVSLNTGTPISLDIDDSVSEDLGDISTVVFRVVQEAVSNSLRHSGASRISVSLAIENNELLLVVSDDGCGFDVAEARERALRGEHLGLLGLDERVMAAGGTLGLDSEIGVGTLLRISIPMPE